MKASFIEQIIVNGVFGLGDGRDGLGERLKIREKNRFRISGLLHRRLTLMVADTKSRTCG